MAAFIPEWDPTACIPCGNCLAICLHVAIRMKVYEEKDLAGALTMTFGPKVTIQVAPKDGRSPRALLCAWEAEAVGCVCLEHVSCIKRALGIQGVETSVYAWRSAGDGDGIRGAQVDLFIERDVLLADVRGLHRLIKISEKYPIASGRRK